MTDHATGTSRLESMERWSPKLFLLGGMLVLGSATVNGLHFFASVPLPEAAGLVLNMAGFVVALVGVTGFYPGLAARTPRMAHLSLAIVAAGIAGIAVLAVWAGAMLTVSAPEPPPVVALLSLFLMLVGMCLFGIGILRTVASPRPTGVLLLAFVTVLVVVFTRSVVIGGDPSNAFIVVSEGLESAALLGIGYSLSPNLRSIGSETPSPG